MNKITYSNDISSILDSPDVSDAELRALMIKPQFAYNVGHRGELERYSERDLEIGEDYNPRNPRAPRYIEDFLKDYDYVTIE